MAEGVLVAEINCRLAAVFKDGRDSCSRHVYLSGALVYAMAFSGSVMIFVLVHREHWTIVTADNINRVENCILKDRCVTFRDIAAELSLSVGFVERIIRERLRFHRVCQMDSNTNDRLQQDVIFHQCNVPCIRLVWKLARWVPVSYTHLTLPTIYSV